MVKPSPIQTTLPYYASGDSEDQTGDTGRSNRSPNHKLILVIHDVLMVVTIFPIVALALPTGLGRIFPDHALMLGALSLVLIASLLTGGIYSYHVIFFRDLHYRKLIEAFGWSFLTFGVVLAVYNWPHLISSVYVKVLLFFTTIAMTVLSRYYWGQIVNILKSVGMSLLLIGGIGLISPEASQLGHITWRLILFSLILSLLAVGLGRHLIVHRIFGGMMRRYFRRQLIIIGSNKEAERIATYIIDNNAPYWIAGFISDRDVDSAVPKDRIGGMDDLGEITDNYYIQEIIVTDKSITKGSLITLLDDCTSKGITVWFPPDLLPVIEMKLKTGVFCGLNMIRLCSQKHDWTFDKLKHTFDLLISFPIFIVLSPVFLVSALLIKANSEGPVFYRATAIGRNSKIFRMLKFRSMVVGNSSSMHKEYVSRLIRGDLGKDASDGQPLKITDDPRVTSVGRILRKFSLDELPQIINVLKGEMSLVGPRPCLPYEFEIYEDWHKQRTRIRPGITGLWQVTGRSEVAFEDMILLDFYYIYNRNIYMDLNILYETIFVILEKRGAY